MRNTDARTFAKAALAGAVFLSTACEFDDAPPGKDDGGTSGTTTVATTDVTTTGPSTTDTTGPSTTTSTDTTATTSDTTGSGGMGGASSGTGGTGGGSTTTSGTGGTGGGGTGGSGDLDAGMPTAVDDNVVGTGPNQFNYVGMWKMCQNTICTTASTPPLYMSTNHWAGGADAGTNHSVTVAFTGTQITFYGVKDTHYGIGAVSIDNGAETMIDFYAAARAGDQPMWNSGALASGAHTFKLRVTGNKSASSTDSTIAVDRVDIR